MKDPITLSADYCEKNEQRLIDMQTSFLNDRNIDLAHFLSMQKINDLIQRHLTLL